VISRKFKFGGETKLTTSQTTRTAHAAIPSQAGLSQHMADEAHDRDGEEKYGNVHPPLRAADALSSWSALSRVPAGDSCHGERRGEEEIPPGRALDPYQQMRQRHRPHAPISLGCP
jgi:hypothetical protein